MMPLLIGGQHGRTAGRHTARMQIIASCADVARLKRLAAENASSESFTIRSKRERVECSAAALGL